MYKPASPFITPLVLLTSTVTTVSGFRKKTYQAVASGATFYGSFKSYGGTERDVNGVYAIEDTAEIETWFRPDITSGCAVALANSPSVIYEVMGEPENIEMRNMFLKFKVSRVKGGA